MAALHNALEIHFSGPVEWHGYQMECPECGSAGPWLLRTGLYDSGDRGETSQAECPEGHVLWNHPLIYPELVHRLDEAAGGSGQADRVHLQVIEGWEPHLKVDREFDGTDYEGGIFGIVKYYSWHRTRGLPDDWWQNQWPDLVRAARDAGAPLPYWLSPSSSSGRPGAGL